MTRWLTLDRLRFGVAGGTLAGTVKLDGAQTPIRAAAALKARKLNLGRLFPAVNLKQAGIGEVNGDVNLRGQGDNVAAMRGSANGELSMVAGGADISKLMMETISLRLLEMLHTYLGHAAFAELHRRNLLDHYRPARAVRRGRYSSAVKQHCFFPHILMDREPRSPYSLIAPHPC